MPHHKGASESKAEYLGIETRELVSMDEDNFYTYAQMSALQKPTVTLLKVDEDTATNSGTFDSQESCSEVNVTKTFPRLAFKNDEDNSTDSHTFDSQEFCSVMNETKTKTLPRLPSFLPTPKRDNVIKNSLPKFNVSLAEWTAAEQYFAENPHAIKYDKRHSALLHSFIKVEGVIYAISNRKVEKLNIPRGANAKIKTILDRNNKKYALRIEAKEWNIPEPSSHISRKIGFMLGEEFRAYGKVFRSMRQLPMAFKHYSVLKFVEGEELRTYIKSTRLTQTQKLKIAIKCVEAILELQKERVVNADIKPANFIIDAKDDNNPIVNVVDFGFSKLLPADATFVSGGRCGTREYMAPEILLSYPPRYSFASEIYAIGVMFSRDLGLGHICSNMRDPRPNYRSTLADHLRTLKQHLKFEENPKEYVAEYKAPPTIAPSFHIVKQRVQKTTPLRFDWMTPMAPLQEMPNLGLIAILSKDINALYRELKRQDPFITRWGKSLGKSRGQKRQVRHDMLNNIKQLMSTLLEDKTDSISKMKMLYAYLSSIQTQINEEHNHYPSTLFRLCSSLKEELANEFNKNASAQDAIRKEIHTFHEIYLQLAEDLNRRGQVLTNPHKLF